MMFGPSANAVVRKGYAALANAKIQYIDGDHDVFGDGKVVLLSTPGHTQGHQSLYVKLAQSPRMIPSIGHLRSLPLSLSNTETARSCAPLGLRRYQGDRSRSFGLVEARYGMP